MRTALDERGFTLAELMVVVLIIGLLVAIAVPVFGAARASAEGSSCFSNQRAVEGAAQMYHSVVGSPAPAGDIVAGGWCVPAYMLHAPHCPADSAQTPYAINAEGAVGTGASGDSSGCPVDATTGHGHF